MNWKRITAIFVGVSLVVILGYDLLAIMQGGNEATISHLVITLSYQYPPIPFLVGFVMGHLFWRMSETKETAALTRKDTIKD